MSIDTPSDDIQAIVVYRKKWSKASASEPFETVDQARSVARSLAADPTIKVVTVLCRGLPPNESKFFLHKIYK